MAVDTAKFVGTRGLAALATSLLTLVLLGGCAEPDHPATEAPSALTSASNPTGGLRSSALVYTSHQALKAEPEVVSIDIADGFTLAQRAKILRAVNEWNYVLNGVVHLDIVSAPAGGEPAVPRLRRWVVMPVHGVVPQVMRDKFGDMLALTVGKPSTGGLVFVYVDRLWLADVGGVMRHELGHVLGLDHDPHGHLMSAHYRPDDQQCIDRSAAAAIAAKRNLPLAAFNWCG